MRERHLQSSLRRFGLSAALSTTLTTILTAAVFLGLGLGAPAMPTGMFAPREAQASVAIAASLEDVARTSSVIARVTALDRESRWEEGRIVTYSRVRVDDVIAGATPSGARELRIRTLGGRVGNIGQLVEGEAALAPSERSIVFLAVRSGERPSDVVVVGRAQGQLLIRRDLHGHEIVRIGAAGEIVARAVRPPLRAHGQPIMELDGAALDAVILSAKRAWEVGHAR